MIAFLLFSIFVICLLCSIPLGVSIGMASLIVMEFVPGAPSTILLIKNAVVGADNFPLVAVPMFILAGDLMLVGGLSARIIAVADMLVGRFRGGLAYVNVLASMFFAALSGSSPATVAAIGSNMIPQMEKHGYRRDFSAALTASSGMLGVMIPPSIPLIIYGVTANASLSALFLAGILPGVIFGISFMVAARFVVEQNMDVAIAQPDTAAKSHEAGEFVNGLWALAVPVIILGGIYGGVFTPTEAAGVAVIYALFVGVVIYREIGLEDIVPILVRSSVVSGTVMLIVVMAFAFGRLLAIQQVPSLMVSLMSGVSTNPLIILLLINFILLIVGCFMEPVAAILILTPILLPVVTSLGVDVVHFGIIITCNLAIGFCTPPVGINLFVASSIAKIPVEHIIRKLPPFFVSMLVSMAIVTYVPAVSLYLPSLTK